MVSYVEFDGFCILCVRSSTCSEGLDLKKKIVRWKGIAAERMNVLTAKPGTCMRHFVLSSSFLCWHSGGTSSHHYLENSLVIFIL